MKACRKVLLFTLWLLSQALGLALVVPPCGGGVPGHESFGEPIRATGPVAFVNPFRFSTKYCDDETGHYYYGYRYYSPTQGRWLSRDPIGEYGGINLYAYVLNDPLNFVDPYGLWSFIRWLYTGDGNASDEVYNAATEAAGDYIYYCGGVRGGYIGLGIGGKVKGKGSIAGAVGFTGTWTVDDGAAISLDVGVGLQERGRNSCGRFASQTIGVGGGYQFWNEMDGFQNPNDGLEFGGIYGGTAESGKVYNGGANFGIGIGSNVSFGINYGPVYGGLIVDPRRMINNFRDTFNVLFR